MIERSFKSGLKVVGIIRNYQSQGHAIAFDRLALSVSVVIV